MEKKQEKIFSLQEKIMQMIYEEELQDVDFACAYVKGSLSLIDLTQEEVVKAAEEKIKQLKEEISLQDTEEEL